MKKAPKPGHCLVHGLTVTWIQGAVIRDKCPFAWLVCAEGTALFCSIWNKYNHPAHSPSFELPHEDPSLSLGWTRTGRELCKLILYVFRSKWPCSQNPQPLTPMPCPHPAFRYIPANVSYFYFCIAQVFFSVLGFISLLRENPQWTGTTATQRFQLMFSVAWLMITLHLPWLPVLQS